MEAPIIYCWDDKNIYSYTMEAQIDPLETEKSGKDVYMELPINGTYLEPLEPKEKFDIVWNGKFWEYKEQPQIQEEQYEPTALDRIYEELFEAQRWLNSHDYIGTKIATGRATIEDYKEEIARMDEYAEKVTLLKNKIKELEKKNV